jgi:outer membrane protein assembly factor BamB
MHRAHAILVRGLLALVCLAGPARFAAADDWPQWLGEKRDGVWRETGILEKFPPGGPKVLWRRAIGGGYAGPAVAGGLVYVTDRVLDDGQKDPGNPFQRSNSRGKERVLCLEADTGKVVWEDAYPCRYTMSYPCGPRATPVVAGGKVYVLGAMGDLRCYEARKGKPLWARNLVKDYDARVPIWGFSAPPLLDGDLLYCLVGRDPVVVAFDAATGKERWRALQLESAEIGYCPPMIYTFGGKRQLIVWHPESVNGLDPATGKVLWTHEWQVKANLTIPTPRQVGNLLFLTSFYNGCRLLDVGGDSVKEVWRSNGRGEQPGQTDKLHSIMSTPFIRDGYIYGVCSYGELRCLDLKDGRRVWSDRKATGSEKEPTRWANAFLVPNGDRVFLFNEKGDLIIARLSPKGYEEIDRAHLLDPTGQLFGGGRFGPGRKVVWMHPAFAGKAVFARNDREIVAVSLAAEK